MGEEDISHTHRIEVSDEMSLSVLGWMMQIPLLPLSTTSL